MMNMDVALTNWPIHLFKTETANNTGCPVKINANSASIGVSFVEIHCNLVIFAFVVPSYIYFVRSLEESSVPDV